MRCGPVFAGAGLGQLGSAFDHMLEVIESRDQELRDSAGPSEARVGERTMALEQEIAERQRAALHLQESEDFPRVDEAAPGIISGTTDGIIRLSNSAFRKMFGYTEEELIGNSVSELLLTPAHARELGCHVAKLLETKRGRALHP